MENNNTQHNNLKESVLQKIRRGDVSMRPRIFFFVQVAFLVLLTTVIFITTVLLLSFMFFSLKASGQLFLLGFGWRGLTVFFELFPWKTLLLLIMLLILLEKLIKRFRFGYRSPVVYVVGGLSALVLAIVFVVNLTPFHSILFRRARQHHLPVVGDYYMHVRKIPKEKGVFRGTVVAINGNILTLQGDERDSDDIATSSERMGDRIQVVLPPNATILPLIQKGDHIFAAGTIEKDGLHAFGIQKIMPAEEEYLEQITP